MVTYPEQQTGGGQTLSREAEVTILDYATISRIVTIDANGVATLTLPPPSPGTRILYDRLTVYSESTQQTECRVYERSVSALTFCDGTPTGNLDVAEYPNGLLVDDRLIIQWSKGSVGALCSCRAQYRTVGIS